MDIAYSINNIPIRLTRERWFQITENHDDSERKAIGLTFFEYSLLAQRTEIGPRSFPLTGLVKLSDELREIAFDILSRPPVSDILYLSAYTPSFVETIPITSIHAVPVTDV